MKVMVACGVNWGFRGHEEHARLTRDQIYHGIFPPSHAFAGREFWGIQDILSSTSHDS